jgi:hypothetical protein
LASLYIGATGDFSVNPFDSAAKIPTLLAKRRLKLPDGYQVCAAAIIPNHGTAQTLACLVTTPGHEQPLFIKQLPLVFGIPTQTTAKSAGTKLPLPCTFDPYRIDSVPFTAAGGTNRLLISIGGCCHLVNLETKDEQATCVSSQLLMSWTPQHRFAYTHPQSGHAVMWVANERFMSRIDAPSDQSAEWLYQETKAPDSGIWSLSASPQGDVAVCGQDGLFIKLPARFLRLLEIKEPLQSHHTAMFRFNGMLQIATNLGQDPNTIRFFEWTPGTTAVRLHGSICMNSPALSLTQTGASFVVKGANVALEIIPRV